MHWKRSMKHRENGQSSQINSSITGFGSELESVMQGQSSLMRLCSGLCRAWIMCLHELNQLNKFTYITRTVGVSCLCAEPKLLAALVSLVVLCLLSKGLQELLVTLTRQGSSKGQQGGNLFKCQCIWWHFIPETTEGSGGQLLLLLHSGFAAQARNPDKEKGIINEPQRTSCFPPLHQTPKSY